MYIPRTQLQFLRYSQLIPVKITIDSTVYDCMWLNEIWNMNLNIISNTKVTEQLTQNILTEHYLDILNDGALKTWNGTSGLRFVFFFFHYFAHHKLRINSRNEKALNISLSTVSLSRFKKSCEAAGQRYPTPE